MPEQTTPRTGLQRPEFDLPPGKELWDAMRKWYIENGLHIPLDQREVKPFIGIDEVQRRFGHIFESDEEVDDFLRDIEESKYGPRTESNDE